MSQSNPAKVALVTGGSRGIGHDLALSLAKEGWAVALSYVSQPQAAQQVVAEIEGQGGRALALAGDVANPASAEQFFDQTEAAFGGVDLLVNNAGIIHLKPISDFDPADFARVIEVNLLGVFHMLRQAAKRLRPGGSIVNFSTSALATSLPGYAAYNASKAAVEAMTKVLAKELGPRGITVNAVAPGPVATELFFQDKSQELIDRLVSLTPLGRLGQTTDIAPVVAFLASPGARWITGQVLRINGGLG